MSETAQFAKQDMYREDTRMLRKLHDYHQLVNCDNEILFQALTRHHARRIVENWQRTGTEGVT